MAQEADSTAEPSTDTDTTDSPEPAAAENNGNGDPETFDREYVQKLRQESARYRTEAKEAETLRKRVKEIEDAEKSDLERTQTRAETAEHERDQAQVELLRLRVAAKHSIPEDLIDLVSGTTEDEINDRAERLAKRLGDAAIRAPSVPAGPRGKPGTAENPESAVAQGLLALTGRTST